MVIVYVNGVEKKRIFVTDAEYKAKAFTILYTWDNQNILSPNTSYNIRLTAFFYFAPGSADSNTVRAKTLA